MEECRGGHAPAEARQESPWLRGIRSLSCGVAGMSRLKKLLIEK